jgi:hypothetical protein
MPSPAHEVECLSTPAKSEKIQVAELVWPAKAKSAARSPLHSIQKGKVKFTFNVSKCDKIFDELFKNGNIKLSHTIPLIEELKKCVYCKWHGSFLHNTNDCNIFRRQIQSVVDEGRLRFQKMNIDRQTVPVDTLGPVDKKVLVRPYSADKGKGKNIIIGDPRAPNLTHGVVTQKAIDKRKANKTEYATGHGAPGMPKYKCFGGEGRDKQKGKRLKVTFEQLLAKYHEQIKVKDVDQTGIAKPSGAPLKPSKSPPKRKSRNQDWGGEEFHASATYPPFGSPIPMQYGSAPSYFHPYPSWGWYDSNAYSSSYFRPHNIEYSSHFNSDFEEQSYYKDRFIYKNRSRAQNKDRMDKQVYVVKKDNRKAKSSDLNSCIIEPEEVLDTLASSTQTIEKSASDSPGTKSKLKKPNVPKQPRSPLGLSI